MLCKGDRGDSVTWIDEILVCARPAAVAYRRCCIRYRLCSGAAESAYSAVEGLKSHRHGRLLKDMSRWHLLSSRLSQSRRDDEVIIQ